MLDEIPAMLREYARRMLRGEVEPDRWSSWEIDHAADELDRERERNATPKEDQP